MIKSRDRILTTHVGSLPRNEVLIRREAGEAIDAAVMAAEMDRSSSSTRRWRRGGSRRR